MINKKMHTLQELMINENGFAFHPQSGESYQLSPTAASIIRLLLDGCIEEEIISAIAEEYDVSDDIARRDLGGFLLNLNELQLISNKEVV